MSFLVLDWNERFKGIAASSFFSNVTEIKLGKENTTAKTKNPTGSGRLILILFEVASNLTILTLARHKI